MKHQYHKTGFTIIEVLIVLAIAGLIMLVVFLAVPNLQRNNRNNSIIGEASRVLAAYEEVSSVKGGGPLSPSLSTTAGSDADKVKQAANVSNFTVVEIQVQPADNAHPNPALNKAVIRTGAKCISPNDLPTGAGVPAKRTVVTFRTEQPPGISYSDGTPWTSLFQCRG